MIGRITRPHGVRGEVKVEVRTDVPERFTWLDVVLVGDDELIPMQVERARLHQNSVILKLEGCDSRDQADTLRGQYLQVAMKDAIPLAEGEFFLFQLIGLEVVTAKGEKLGHLKEVLETGANDVLIVAGAAGELLLPDIPQVVETIDLKAGKIVVNLPAGLRDE